MHIKRGARYLNFTLKRFQIECPKKSQQLEKKIAFNVKCLINYFFYLKSVNSSISSILKQLSAQVRYFSCNLVVFARLQGTDLLQTKCFLFLSFAIFAWYIPAWSLCMHSLNYLNFIKRYYITHVTSLEKLIRVLCHWKIFMHDFKLTKLYYLDSLDNLKMNIQNSLIFLN